MPPLKVAQVAARQMHPASVRASSQVALPPGPGPNRGWRASSLLVQPALVASGSPAACWELQHPVGREEGGQWGGTPGWVRHRELRTLVAGCGAMHGWGSCVGPASPIPCLLEETPSSVACCDASACTHSLSTTGHPLSLSRVPSILFSLCYLSFIFQLPWLFAFLRRWRQAPHWPLCLNSSCVCFTALCVYLIHGPWELL